MCINGAYTIFRNETKRKARYCVTPSLADSIRQWTRLGNLDKHGQHDDILYWWGEGRVGVSIVRGSVSS